MIHVNVHVFRQFKLNVSNFTLKVQISTLIFICE